MTGEDLSPQIHHYVSALADVQRLQILARLVEAPCSIDQISAATGLRTVDLQSQLDLLVELELIERSQEQETVVYAYKAKTMETLIKTQSTSQKPRAASPWDGMPEEARRRTLSLTNAAGLLEYIPTQPKKLLPILEHVVGSFEKDQEYSEKEVNILLGKYTRDTSTLRRFLVDQGFLRRTPDGAKYWRK